jgi:hypothetical protein
MQLFQSRWFWWLVTALLVALAAASWRRHEPVLMAVYLGFGIYSVARALGWHARPP